jgi:hypothetical protein
MGKLEHWIIKALDPWIIGTLGYVRKRNDYPVLLDGLVSHHGVVLPDHPGDLVLHLCGDLVLVSGT